MLNKTEILRIAKNRKTKAVENSEWPWLERDLDILSFQTVLGFHFFANRWILGLEAADKQC